MIRKALLLSTLALLLVLGPAASASTVALGPGSEPALTTWHPLVTTPIGAGWLVGPRTVEADPVAGQWLKNLQSPGWLLGFTDTFYLLEVLKVGSGPAWVGWHEDLLTPGWEWGSGVMFAYEPNNGSSSNFSWNLFGLLDPLAKGEISGGSIDFFFDALDPGSWVFTLKTIDWTGGEGSNWFAPLRIAENPSAVPIPGAAFLLGSGLLGLIVFRRNKVKA